MKRNIAIIQANMHTAEMLDMLRTECGELGRATIQLQVTINPDNPSPATTSEAYRNVLEELADIGLCLDLLGINNAIDRLRVDQIKREKAERLVERLQAKEV